MPDGPESQAPLRVLSTLALRGPFETILFPAFTEQTGEEIEATWAPAGILLESVRAGADANLLVLTPPALAILQSEGRVRPEPVKPLAASAVGLAVASGAPRPDLSTPETVRAAFLAARTIAYSASGASGVHFLALLERMEIAPTVRPRALCVPEGLTGERLVTGEADLAIQQLSELHLVPGIDVVGALPRSIGLRTEFACGLTTSSRKTTAASTLFALMDTPAFRQSLARFGLTPIP